MYICMYVCIPDRTIHFTEISKLTTVIKVLVPVFRASSVTVSQLLETLYDVLDESKLLYFQNSGSYIS